MVRLLLLLSILLFSINISAMSTAIGHGPIGLMADHFHKKGEWMISLRVSNMEMKKNTLDGKNISDIEVLNQPNPSFKMSSMNDMPMMEMSSMKMPKNLSVIPRKMTMRMIMLGAMYAPSDKINLMGMAMFNDKEMELDTYRGMMNRNYLGSFETSSSDLSKISLSALFNLHENESSRWHLIGGLEKSIGENTKKGMVLTPMNTNTSITLPYGMQPSDKALRLLTGVTNVTKINNFVLGNQILFRKSIEEEDWNFGDEFEYNLWFQGSFNGNISYSLRLNYLDTDSIIGKNENIMAPVQTANPRNYGGEILNIGIGFNFITNFLPGKHSDRLAIEYIIPIDQDKSGLQMRNEAKFIIGFQKSL